MGAALSITELRGYTNPPSRGAEGWSSPCGAAVPRHMMIIYEINHRFMLRCRRAGPAISTACAHVDIEKGPGTFDHGEPGDGRSAQHQRRSPCTRICQGTPDLPDFNEMWPERFNNKTNASRPAGAALRKSATVAVLTTLGKRWTTTTLAIWGPARMDQIRRCSTVVTRQVRESAADPVDPPRPASRCRPTRFRVQASASRIKLQLLACCSHRPLFV